MDNHLKDHIEYLLCVNIEGVRSVSGGDTSQGYLLETESELFFCKVNHADQADTLFLAEKKALEAIASTKTIAVPKVVLCEVLDKGGFLVMQYIAPKRASPQEMEHFGHQLAQLHQNSATDTFGWEADNYIGSLPQSNKVNSDWAKFYVAERLLPQLRLAADEKRLLDDEIPSEKTLLKACQTLFPVVKPSLLHGDLWSGNYIISQDGQPYLIDPATYYGHHEVDIAMTRLFGGFDTSFYGAYNEHFPQIGGEEERKDIYQLYFLLVHLNLFGKSYYRPVKDLLNRYF
ncbi:Fructosamine-3-kinase [Pricia antarctica]|uniref:Fructosamine-3-kinase n=1 Tax=Pricia antarctica TaxID=641691 RepID=A0A1G6X9C2_9FLAO|nr:fructosamine kinase family protein [Pricia antarctica]SDD73875.1 Fructosamine-3-kinase [Pricia antarctica]